jgi:hypothetical protein
LHATDDLDELLVERIARIVDQARVTSGACGCGLAKRLTWRAADHHIRATAGLQERAFDCWGEQVAVHDNRLREVSRASRAGIRISL